MWTIGEGTADVLRSICTTPVADDTLLQPALLIVVGLGMVAYDYLHLRQRATGPHQAVQPPIEHPDA